MRVESAGAGTQDGEATSGLAFAQQWHEQARLVAQRGGQAGHAGKLLRALGSIRHGDQARLQNATAGAAARIERPGLEDVVGVVGRVVAGIRHRRDHLALGHDQRHRLAGKQLAAALHDGPEYRPGVRDRAADHAQDVGCGGLALQRLLALTQQPRVLRRHVFGLRLRRARLGGALGHLLLETGGKAQVVQRHGGLCGEHGQLIPVGVMKTTERALDVGIQETEHALLHHQRRQQAGALLDSRHPIGSVAQAYGAAARGLFQPGGDRLQQRRRVFAARQQGAGDLPGASVTQHQQHPLGTTELGHLVDQELMQPLAAAQLVHAGAAIHQALERLAQVALDRQVRQALGVRQAAVRRFAQPGCEKLAVQRMLVQVAAAQAFVSHVVDRHQQHAVSLLQRRPGGVRLSVGNQCLAVQGPDVLALTEPGARKAVLVVQRGAAPGGTQGCSGISTQELRSRQQDQYIQLETGVAGTHMAQKALQAFDSGCSIALGHRQYAGPHLAVVPCHRFVEGRDQGVVVRPFRPRTGHVTHLDFPGQDDARFQRLIQPRAHALGRHNAQPTKPASRAPQAEFAKRQREVAKHQHLAIDIAAAPERLRCLAHYLQTFGNVGTAETLHIERIGQPIFVARLPRQDFGLARRVAGRFVLRQTGVGKGLDPVRPPLVQGVARRREQLRHLLRGGQCGVVLRRAQLCLGQAQQATGRKRHVTHFPRHGMGLRCGGQRRLDLPQAHRSHRLAHQRQHGQATVVLLRCQCQHRVAIRSSVGELALGNQRLRPQVQQGNPPGYRNRLHGEALIAGFNRLHVQTSQGQLTHLPDAVKHGWFSRRLCHWHLAFWRTEIRVRRAADSKPDQSQIPENPWC